MKKKLLQEVIDSLIKEELKRQHKKYLKEFAGNELQAALNAFAQNSAAGTPAALKRAETIRGLIQTSLQQNPSIINQIPTAFRSALGIASPATSAAEIGTGLATTGAGGVGGAGSIAGAGGGGAGTGLATTGGTGLATTGAAETAALGAGAEGAAAATGAAEAAALTAGAGEAAAGGTAAATGATGAGLGLSSVLPAAAAGTAGYVGGRIANAGIGAGLRAAGADVSQGAENASGWGDLSLGSWLSGLAGNGIQEPRTTQRGMPTPTGTQMPTPTDMSQVGNNINQINSAIQEFRRDFERQTAEIRSQMQSARSSNVANTSSTPKSSTSTTGTK